MTQSVGNRQIGDTIDIQLLRHGSGDYEINGLPPGMVIVGKPTVTEIPSGGYYISFEYELLPEPQPDVIVEKQP